VSNINFGIRGGEGALEIFLVCMLYQCVEYAFIVIYLLLVARHL